MVRLDCQRPLDSKHITLAIVTSSCGRFETAAPRLVCIRHDRYMKRDDLGSILSDECCAVRRRDLVGHLSSKDCSNARHMDANCMLLVCARYRSELFWESDRRFIRWRSELKCEKGRCIFWQCRIREGDVFHAVLVSIADECGGDSGGSVVLPIPGDVSLERRQADDSPRAQRPSPRTLLAPRARALKKPDHCASKEAADGLVVHA